MHSVRDIAGIHFTVKCYPMIKYFSFAGLLLLAVGCHVSSDRHNAITTKETPVSTRLYAQAVGDSFSIFVSLPADYHPEGKESYPVVYLLDANLYFDIMATTINKYAEVGLAPNVILVGIGYKDFLTMDSLRNRDDTYPLAIPEYEMSVSGGADKFLWFINNELVPYIDQAYKTDTTKRVLMGHSLGGYFTMYALQQSLAGKESKVHNYIAASPSLHYNNYYLLSQFKSNAIQQHAKTKLFLTYGGLENSNDTTSLTLDNLSAQLTAVLPKQADGVAYKCEIYSNLDHMDTQLPTFVKGLQWVFAQ